MVQTSVFGPLDYHPHQGAVLGVVVRIAGGDLLAEEQPN